MTYSTIAIIEVKTIGGLKEMFI